MNTLLKHKKFLAHLFTALGYGAGGLGIYTKFQYESSPATPVLLIAAILFLALKWALVTFVKDKRYE
jgi:phosphatidylserine synthase